LSETKSGVSLAVDPATAQSRLLAEEISQLGKVKERLPALNGIQNHIYSWLSGAGTNALCATADAGGRAAF
jgi:hypothetical protein